MKKSKVEFSEKFAQSAEKFHGRLVDVRSFAKQLLRLEAQGLQDFEPQLIADFREGGFDEKFIESARKIRDAMKAAAAKRADKRAEKKAKAAAATPTQDTPPAADARTLSGKARHQQQTQ